MEDPLDRNDFDPVAYINEHFPTEESLDTLETYMVGLNSKIGALEEEISKSVQTQSLVGQQTNQDVLEAQISITDLFAKIGDIKMKASQSERMVQEICADIKKLDYAKTHLQASITALKRLQMLITAIGQLEILAQEYQYKEVANLLDAVKQLMAHFDQYTEIPLVFDLQKRIDAIQNDLTSQVHRAFREIGQLIDSVADLSVIMQGLPGHLRSISDACLVVDALGGEARRALLSEFVDLQLIPYEQMFGNEKLHCTLEEVDRRWAWFKRLVKSVDSKFSSVCPSHWRLPLRLCVRFMETTKQHLIHILTQLDSRDAIDVSLLLKALQTALRFEQEMESYFEPVFIQAGLKRGRSTEFGAISISPDSVTFSSGGDNVSSVNMGNIDDEEEKLFLTRAQTMFKGGISYGFDRFLGRYVLLEKNNLEEMLKRLSQEEDTAQSAGDGSNSTGSGNIYGSSISMFVFIKNSIKRCTALTTGQAFLSLTKEFKTSMQQYAEMLRIRCPTLYSQVTVSSGAIVSSVGYVAQPLCRLTPGQESVVCYIINTGEYCSEVVPQLEQLIKTKMDEGWREKVDLTAEIDTFNDLTALGLKAAVGGAMERLDVSFRAMSSKNWANDAQVGEESAHVLQMGVVLTDFVPKIREFLSSSYFNTFCTRLATEMLQRYLDTIMKQKTISEAGSQQLLLDTYNLKTLLTHLHGLGAGAGDVKAPPGVYTKFIVGRAAQIETVLKLVGTASEMLIERFRIMWPEGRMEDLIAIMTLKGLKKSDQQVLLDTQVSLIAPLITGSSSTSSLSSGTQLGQSTMMSSSASLAGSYFSMEPSGGGAAMVAGGAAVASASLAVASSVTQMTSSAMTSLSAVGNNLKWGAAPTNK